MTRFGIIDVTKPYSFIRFGAIDVTKPNEIIGFGAIDVTKAYEFIGFGAFYFQFWFQAQLPQPGSWTSRLGCTHGHQRPKKQLPPTKLNHREEEKEEFEEGNFRVGCW